MGLEKLIRMIDASKGITPMAKADEVDMRPCVVEEPKRQAIPEKISFNGKTIGYESSTYNDLKSLNTKHGTLTDVILDTIENAVHTMDDTIGKENPNWNDEYQVDTVVVKMIDDHVEFRDFILYYDLANAVIPSSEVIMPILVKFTSNSKKHVLPMTFVHFICLTSISEETVEHLNYLVAADVNRLSSN